MNKIYKLIWSKTKNCWVVASELAKGHGKNKSRVKNSLLAVFVMSALLAGGVADVQALTQQEKDEIKNEVALDLLDKIAHGGEIPGAKAEYGLTNFPDAIANRIFYYNDVSSKIGEKLKKDGLTLRYFGVRPDYYEPSRDYLERYANKDWTNVNNDGAFGAHSMALGYRAFSEAKHGVAIGRSALAGGSLWKGDYGGDGGVAIGNHAWALGDKSVSVGNDARAVHKGIAIGIQAEAGLDEDDNTTDWSTTPGFTPKPGKSIQYDPKSKLPYVTSDLTEKFGAIAIGTDAKAHGRHSTAIGTGSKAKAPYAWSLGFDSEASGGEAIAFGNRATAKGRGAIAIGSAYESSSDGAKAYSTDTIAIGRGAKAGNENDTATEYNSIAIGPNAQAYSGSSEKVQNSTALGAGAYASKSGVTAVGASAVSVSANSTVVGYKAVAASDNSVVLGANTRSDIDGGVALGSDSNVGSYASPSYGKAGKVGYDPLGTDANGTSTWKSTKAAVSVGNQQKDITRQIINVAAGSDDTDAVNVAQLKSLGRKAWKDLVEERDKLATRIVSNEGNITTLFGKVRTNTQDIGRLKTDVNTNDRRIRYLYDNMPFMHYVSVNEENTNKTTDNRRNDGAKKVGSIAIGVNAYAHGEEAVTLGYNSFSRGQGSVIVGESSDNYTGGLAAKKGQFDQSIILGSNNTIFAQAAKNGGREDKIIGNMNRVEESHGTFVRGTGNMVYDAYNDEALTDEDKQKERDFLDPIDGGDPTGLFQKGRSHVTVEGDGNLVGGALYTQISGVGNEVSNTSIDDETSTPKVTYNIVTGNRNTVIDSSHNLIMGDNHELEKVNGNIIIGSLKTKAKTEASNVTILGNEANVSVEGGVALGTGSVASTAAGVFGYDPATDKASTTDNATWKSGNGAVSVGTKDKTRQITNLAAGTKDTDAVNVAQLKAIKQKIDDGAIHYFSVRSDDSANPKGTNWENDGANGRDAVAIGSFAKAKREFTTAVGAKTAAAGKGANAYGGGIAAGEGTVAIGQNAVAASKPGITQEEYDTLREYNKKFYISSNNGLYYQYQHQDGKRTKDEQNYNIAIGSGTESYANQTVSLGYKAKSDVDGGVALGAESSANRQAGGIGYIATGSSATFEDALTTLNKKEDYDKWTAIVDASKKEYDDLTKKFDKATTKENKAEAKAALDAWKKQHADFVDALASKEKLEATWKGTKGAVSVGKDEINEAGNRVIASRQITHVAAGTEDTDAVNVAQLKTAKTTVEAGDYVTVTKGTKTGVDGTVYTVTGPKLAPKTEDTNIIVEDDIEEATKKKVGYKLSLNKTLTGLESVTSDEFKSGDNVTINNTGLTITGGPSVTTGGIDAGKKKITNVADGDVSATSTDAVNGKQLNELKQNVAENKVTVEAAKDSQIKVTAEKQTDKSTKYVVDIEKDGTIGGAKDGNLVTGKTVKEYVDANKVTVTGDEDESGVKVENTAEPGKPANYKVSLGDKVKIGNVVIDDKDGKGSISGLTEVKVGDDVKVDKTGLTIKDGPSVTTTGIDAGKKKIINVADGDISETSTDAVNGKQLYELKQNVAENKVTVEAAKDSQIKVTAEKQTDKSTKYVVDIEKDGTIGGAKDGNLVTGKTVKEYVDANKVTVTGDEDESGVKVENTAEPGKPANYKVSLGDKVKIGNVVIDDKDGKGSISGLTEVKVGDDVKLDKEGLTIKDGPSVTKDGINAGNKKITNVADGDISETSTDAVNGKQLYELKQNVAENKVTVEAAKDSQIKVTAEKQTDKSTKYVVDIEKDGTIGGAKDGNLVTGKTVKEYVDANKVTVTGDEDESGVKVENTAEPGKPANYKVSLGDKVKIGNVVIDDKDGKGSISGLTEVKVGDGVKLDKTGLTIKDGPSMTTTGIDAGDKVITGVADGKKETDAVNVRQLAGVEKKVDINSQNISMIGNKMGELGNRVNRVGAGAAALAALHPLDFDPDDKWDFAAGYGNYKGANAAAIGAYYRPNEDTMVSVGGSFGGGENMVNAGIAVKLGQGNHVTTSKVAMAKEIKDLRAEVEVLRQAIVGIGQGQELDPMKIKLFPDIAKNHWAYEAVEELTKQGLLEGYPDGTFGGDRMMTRYEFAEIVYRAMQKGLNVNEKLIQEFEPELERFRIDVISKDKNGNPVIERVRVNKKADTAKMANA